MALVIVGWLPELQRLLDAPRRSRLRRHACRLVVYATLLVAAQAVAQDVPAVLASQTRAPASESTRSAETILASQPSDLVDRLMQEKMIVFQEIREEGPLRGGIVNAYVIFEPPIDRVYPLLAQSDRQIEFRPELRSIETIEMGPHGPIDEQRLRILFRTYIFRLEYRLHPEQRRIEWLLDERFDNDLARLAGYWELFEMADGRTLGRSGTSVDVGPAVPAFLQDWISRKNLPVTMKRVQRWVDSEGGSRS